MGGGKSRAGCEEVFDACLLHPGLKAVIAREAHTSIVETTKKTMLEQVIPAGMLSHQKASMGEDYVELLNGSVIHFIGLNDPMRWYSSEIGLLFFDEAQEMVEDKVVRLITRLRQPGMPNRAILTFNPANPGHWLRRWFMLGEVEQTVHGFYKERLVLEGASSSIGSCEFFFAKARDNTYLPDGYVEETLGGMPEHLRRRYLEGIWEYITGNNFFDVEALTHYTQVALDTRAMFSATTVGDVAADFLTRARREKSKDPPRFKPGRGPWVVWRKPVRADGQKPAHRYVMAIDVSSGGGYDYSGIQIISIEDFEQVAEFQGKLPPTELALEAYRAGRIFNDALAVPEVTGGWGFTIEQELKRLHYPSLYTRKILDRLSKKWTDRTGWDTTAKTRAHMLDTLERLLREKEFGLYSHRTLAELGTFVYGANNKPEAQEGTNDDLVVSLAIAVTVALELPKQVRRPRVEQYVPRISSVTGY